MSQEVKHTRTGRVVSNKMDKTSVVLLQYRTKHPLLGKIVTKSKRVKMHDPNNETQMGDVVEIMSVRPLSKQKSWQLVRVVEHS